MKQQIVLIHGGDPQESYEKYLEYLKSYKMNYERHGLRKANWQENLSDDLDSKFDVIRPEMPSKRQPKYIEWKIWFENFFPFLNDGVILAGGSLGGTFLAKYLAENDFPKKIKALFLIAGAFGDNQPEYGLYDFGLPSNLSKISSQVETVYLYHSKDDSVVPFEDVNKFKQAIPNATVKVFEDRQHFNQEHLPELVEDIKNLI